MINLWCICKLGLADFMSSFLIEGYQYKRRNELTANLERS